MAYALCLASGGPAPGTEEYFRAIVEECLHQPSVKLVPFGIRHGFRNLALGKFQEVYPLHPSDFCTDPTSIPKWSYGRKGPANLEEAMVVVRTLVTAPTPIEYLFAHGGDGTLHTMAELEKAAIWLHQHEGLPRLWMSMGPKSVDNDSPLPPLTDTIGYSTMASTVAEMAVRTAMDAHRADDRWYLNVVQGRKAGFVAAYAGHLANAMLWLIPEHFRGEQVPLSFAADIVIGAILKGLVQKSDDPRGPSKRCHGAVVVAEGLFNVLDPRTLPGLEQCKRNRKGEVEPGSYPLHERLTEAVNTAIAALGLREIGDIELEAKGNLLGYTARGAMANASDRDRADVFGRSAVYQILRHRPAFVPVEEWSEVKQQLRVTGWNIADFPLNDDGSIRSRYVQTDTDERYLNWWQRCLPHRLTLEDLEDPSELIAATNLSGREFLSRFRRVAAWGSLSATSKTWR